MKRVTKIIGSVLIGIVILTITVVTIIISKKEISDEDFLNYYNTYKWW